MSFVSASGPGWSCANSNGMITCAFSGTLAASGGSSTISVVATPNASLAGQTASNYATVDGSGGSNAPTPGPAACTGANTCSYVVTPVRAPSLSIAKSQPSPALEVGRQSTYVLTVSNTSATTATAARVKDLLPPGLTYVSAGGTGWSCSNTGQLVTCNFSGALTQGNPSAIDVVVVPTRRIAGQSVTNYASIDATGGDNPPRPGSTCTMAGSCALATSAVGNTVGRTEAIISNFLVKRGDRIATNGLELNRLVARVSEDDCNDPSPVYRNPPMKLAGPDTNSPRKDSDMPAPITSFPGGHAVLGGAADSRFPTPPANMGAYDRTHDGDFGDRAFRQQAETADARSNTGLGPVAFGTEEQGRMSFAGSLAELRRTTGAAELAKTGIAAKTGCTERRQKSAIDVWFEGTYDYFSYDRSKGSFGLLKAGVDYKLAPGFIVGAMAQFDHTMDKSAAFGYLVKGNGWMAGPYSALRLAPNLFLDGRILWGYSSNEVAPYLKAVDSFETERMLAAIRLSGQWIWNNFKLMPSIEFVHFDDKSAAYVNQDGLAIGSQRVVIDRMIFGPELRYSSHLSNDLTIDYHVGFKGLWDLSPLSLQALDEGAMAERRSSLHGRVDLGVSLQNDGGPTIGVGASLEGLGGDGYSARSTYGTLRIPLN